MESKQTQKICCQRLMTCSKTTFSVIVLLIISTILWIIGCEIFWYGTLWIEDISKLKNEFYILKIIFLLIILGFGFVIVVISVSLALFGIPFTILRINHLFNPRNIQLSNNNKSKNKYSKHAFKYTITIFILVIIGLFIGAAGCEVIQSSGLKFKTLFNNNNELDKLDFYLKQCLLLIVMFAGLLLFFIGLLLAPFMLTFATIVSFDKKKNSYRLRTRRHRSHNAVTQV